MLVFLTSSALISFVFSSPILDFLDARTSQKCIFQLESFGATKNFGMNVAHGIHSITLRELRKLSPNITEDNRIPTINMNLSSTDPILLYAPDRKGPSDGKFMTDGMRTLDEVLSHMGDEAYDIKNFNTLERIVHAFHMEEAWAMVEQAYEKIRENPPNGQVCQCAMDIEHNGVLDKLRFIALAIREPELIYGDKKGVFRSVKKGNHMGGMPAYTFQGRKSQGNDQEKPAYTFQGRNPQENDQVKLAYAFGGRNPQENNQEKPAYTFQGRNPQENDQEKPAYTFQGRNPQENDQEKLAYAFQGRNPQENDQEKPAYAFQGRNPQENDQEKPAYAFGGRNPQENNQEKPAYTFGGRNPQENDQEKPAYTFQGRNSQENDQEKPAYTFQGRNPQENDQEKLAYAFQGRNPQENNQEKPAFIQHINQNDMTQNSKKPTYTYQWRKHLEKPDDFNNIAFAQQINKNTIFAEPKESLYPYRFKRNIDELEKKQEKHLPGYYYPITNQLKTMKKSQSKNSTFKDQNQGLDQDNLLLRKDQSMPHLVGVNAWKKWKHISEMNPQEHVDAALFLYCALN